MVLVVLAAPKYSKNSCFNGQTKSMGNLKGQKSKKKTSLKWSHYGQKWKINLSLACIFVIVELESSIKPFLSTLSRKLWISHRSAIFWKKKKIFGWGIDFLKNIILDVHLLCHTLNCGRHPPVYANSWKNANIWTFKLVWPQVSFRQENCLGKKWQLKSSMSSNIY